MTFLAYIFILVVCSANFSTEYSTNQHQILRFSYQISYLMTIFGKI
jgi:hypothetical protein